MNKLNFMDNPRSNGDCTYTYKVEFEGTLKELTEEILKRPEWGCVKNGVFGKTIFEYAMHEVTYSTEFYKSRQGDQIKIICANGGWGAMDYYIRFKGECD